MDSFEALIFDLDGTLWVAAPDHPERDNGNTLYPNVGSGLRELAPHYRLFLVSNCHQAYLERFLKNTGIGDLFVDSECHGNTLKSKGENIRLVLERNKVGVAAYIGDSASDQVAAMQAGVSYFHVEYGFGVPHRECLTFKNFRELTDFFLDLHGS